MKCEYTKERGIKFAVDPPGATQAMVDGVQYDVVADDAPPLTEAQEKAGVRPRITLTELEQQLCDADAERRGDLELVQAASPANGMVEVRRKRLQVKASDGGTYNVPLDVEYRLGSAPPHWDPAFDPPLEVRSTKVRRGPDQLDVALQYLDDNYPNSNFSARRALLNDSVRHTTASTTGQSRSWARAVTDRWVDDHLETDDPARLGASLARSPAVLAHQWDRVYGTLVYPGVYYQAVPGSAPDAATDLLAQERAREIMASLAAETVRQVELERARPVPDRDHSRANVELSRLVEVTAVADQYAPALATAAGLDDAVARVSHDLQVRTGRLLDQRDPARQAELVRGGFTPVTAALVADHGPTRPGHALDAAHVFAGSSSGDLPSTSAINATTEYVRQRRDEGVDHSKALHRAALAHMEPADLVAAVGAERSKLVANPTELRDAAAKVSPERRTALEQHLAAGSSYDPADPASVVRAAQHQLVGRALGMTLGGSTAPVVLETSKYTYVNMGPDATGNDVVVQFPGGGGKPEVRRVRLDAVIGPDGTRLRLTAGRPGGAVSVDEADLVSSM